MGMIFDIEEFTIHDGPGIRTTVFFKGCPLQCVWCHNPEGISTECELFVKRTLCVNCGRCAEICPRGLRECNACGECVNECPVHIRKICGFELTADELAAKLKKAGDLCDGITISGGEPFFQHEFLFDVLRKLKGFHRAVETSGYTSEKIFAESFNLTELIIMDIKHTDPIIHKAVTGVDNKPILNNLELLKKSDVPFIIRVPLIPGVNDGDENLTATAELLLAADNLIKVELLPYNKMAKTKYRSIGREYNPPFDENKEPNANLKCFKRIGVECIIL